MKRGTTILSGLLAAAWFAGCTTITVRDQGTKQLVSKPDFAEKQVFWFGGYGANHVDVRKACKGKPVTQLQMKHEFTDGLMQGITLGIYSPMTARIWCAN